MKLSTEQLQEIKQELKKFSSAPILKSYKLIAQIYKSEIDPQILIDSQITKSLVRIGSKKYTEDDEEKYAKAIKICRKLVKQWKQVIVTDGETQQEERKVQKQKIVERQSTAEPKIQKKVKPEPNKKEDNKKEDNKNGHKIIQSEEAVEEGKREKAVEALKKYFKQQTQDEQLEWVTRIEQTIFDQYNNQQQLYMEKVKAIVKQIDRNGEFRTKLLKGEFDLVSEVKKLK